MLLLMYFIGHVHLYMFIYLYIITPASLEGLNLIIEFKLQLISSLNSWSCHQFRGKFNNWVWVEEIICEILLFL